VCQRFQSELVKMEIAKFLHAKKRQFRPYIPPMNSRVLRPRWITFFTMRESYANFLYLNERCKLGEEEGSYVVSKRAPFSMHRVR
ncbi:MAG: hypothetical protein WAM28_05235, partial [Chlamydiales bacterium]